MSDSIHDNIGLWTTREEGQFFERKSVFEQRRGGWLIPEGEKRGYRYVLPR
jgi:hypothetical protein